LGNAEGVLVGVEAHAPAGDSRRLASSRFQAVLDAALAASDSRRPEVREQGIVRTDLPHGCGKPVLGAPRIHGELKVLGFDISERTVSKWMRKAPFLNNHREAIAAMNFFTDPTLTFGVLYCYFVIAHNRRRSCISM
jgi:hypothetical protein